MKKLRVIAPTICLALCLTAPASALEYTIHAPDGPDYGKATSIEPVASADNGELPNEDLSKNAALIPPGFGSPSSYLPGSGDYLTPNLIASGFTASSDVISGSTADVVIPGSAIASPSGLTASTSMPFAGHTTVSNDSYYEDGSLGTLAIPSIGLNVKVFEGTGDDSLKNGVGHFEGTSVWDGNVALGGHNRGVNTYFGKIDTLKTGAEITLTTKLGTRTYKVTGVEKISSTNTSVLDSTTENRITLLTCVRDQPDYRWCVRAVAV